MKNTFSDFFNYLVFTAFRKLESDYFFLLLSFDLKFTSTRII